MGLGWRRKEKRACRASFPPARKEKKSAWRECGMSRNERQKSRYPVTASWHKRGRNVNETCDWSQTWKCPQGGGVEEEEEGWRDDHPDVISPPPYGHGVWEGKGPSCRPRRKSVANPPMRGTPVTRVGPREEEE